MIVLGFGAGTKRDSLAGLCLVCFVLLLCLSLSGVFEMHTKEPWIVTGSDRIKYIEARTVNGMLQEIASCLTVSEENGNHEENARRIVACVNACAGIPIETLENAATLIPVKSSLNGYLEMKQQRDELLAALKLARDEFDKLPRSLGYEFDHIPAIDAAISKADLTQ